MKLEYELDEQDYLDFQLFVASQSVSINKALIKGRFITVVVLLLLAIVFYFYNAPFITAGLVGVSIVHFLIFPKHFRNSQKEYLRTHIREHYSNNFGVTSQIEISDESISDKTKMGEMIVFISGIDKIDETEKHFFVKIKAGLSMVIPKDKITNSDEVRAKFESLGFAVNKASTGKWK